MDLTALPAGKWGQVIAVESHGEAAGDFDSTSRRLLDLGFVPGTFVKAMHAAPFFKDPASYLVRGTHVALRLSEAQRVKITAASVEAAEGKKS